MSMTEFMTEGLDFGAALSALKAGRLVMREGWNGMFLLLVSRMEFNVCSGQLLNYYTPDQALDYQPHICKMSGDGTIWPWQPSQAEMLAEDWCIVPQGKQDMRCRSNSI